MPIKIKKLSKVYQEKRVLNNICLDIGKGIFGLVGPEGAGKTVLLNILATLTLPTEGTVVVNDVSLENKRTIQSIIGYLPQVFSVYPVMSVYGVMDYLALLAGIGSSVNRRLVIMKVLEKVKLDRYYKTKVGVLPHVLKQKLGIAQALLHNPQVLLLDEPTAGLDMEEAVQIHDLIRENAKDRSVIVSTENIYEAESLCQELAILNHGEIVYNGTRQEFGKLSNEKKLSTEKVYTSFLKGVQQ